ncbi:hypothetical protein H4582DRAFT_1939580 [Lactarius indigo]|nr:hypothetical protein H4582DRAFT_1939580 [Lactarius indigo]
MYAPVAQAPSTMFLCFWIRLSAITTTEAIMTERPRRPRQRDHDDRGDGDRGDYDDFGNGDKATLTTSRQPRRPWSQQ